MQNTQREMSFFPFFHRKNSNFRKSYIGRWAISFQMACKTIYLYELRSKFRLSTMPGVLQGPHERCPVCLICLGYRHVDWRQACSPQNACRKTAEKSLATGSKATKMIDICSRGVFFQFLFVFKWNPLFLFCARSM